jgi:hypothetical protein
LQSKQPTDELISSPFPFALSLSPPDPEPYLPPFPSISMPSALSDQSPPQKKKIPIMSTYAADASSSTNGADSKPVVTPQDIGWQFVPQY